MATRIEIHSQLEELYKHNINSIEKDIQSNERYENINKNHKKQVKAVISNLRGSIDNSLTFFHNQEKEHEKLLDMIADSSFEGVTSDKPLLMAEYSESMENYEQKTDDIRKQIKTLESPFFGCMILEIDGKTTNHYIGKRGVVDKESKQLVSDWRSPIGGLYYKQNAKGDVELLEIEGNKEKVKILSKERLTFRGGVLTSYVDLLDDKYSLTEILKKDLQERKGGMFKEIITTLQADQDEIIRTPINIGQVIQGCAGSGKTSIALHKLSHLAFTEDIKTDQTVYITPNSLFSDYLKDVQTALGLEEVNFKTFLEWGTDVAFYQTDTFSKNFVVHPQITRSEYTQNTYFNIDEEEIIQFVTNRSRELMLNLIEPTVEKLKVDFEKYEELETLGRLIEKGMDISEAIPELSDIYFKLPGLDDDAGEQFEKLLEKLEYYDLYNQYIKYKGLNTDYKLSEVERRGEDTQRNIEVTFSEIDLPHLLFFRSLLHGKHDVLNRMIVIDEAQNYNEMQLRTMLQYSEKNNFLIVGDIHQRSEVDGIRDLKDLIDASLHFTDLINTDKTQFKVISKCYRTTETIMDVSYAPYRNNTKSEYKASQFFREGIKVSSYTPEKSTIEALDQTSNIVTDSFADVIVEILDSANSKGHNTVAFITEDDITTEIFEEVAKLKISQDLQLREPGDTDYQRGIYFLDSKGSKGLEFDVVVFISGLSKFNDDLSWEEAAEMHISMSRALHELYLVDLGLVKEL